MREVVLQKPVLINFRNQSADDFLKDMLGLKKELNAIGNNFNQAVHKLHNPWQDTGVQSLDKSVQWIAKGFSK